LTKIEKLLGKTGSNFSLKDVFDIADKRHINYCTMKGSQAK